MNVNKLLRIGRCQKVKLFQKSINAAIRFIYSCDIPCQTQIDDSAVFTHDGLGCVINRNCIIEAGVFIQHRVTLGVKRSGEGAPVLRKNCAIGPGAIILGNVEIGHDAVVGAGAVVVKDVPPFAVVGVPSKILYYRNNENCT